jgi:membrane-bound lytic murein transglycosylase B
MGYFMKKKHDTRNRGSWKTSLAVLIAMAGQTVGSGGLPKEIADFVHSMAQRHGFQERELVRIFEQTKSQPSIIKAIRRPAEAKPWYVYRGMFLSPSRIDQGKRFMNQHRALLESLENAYGVPSAILVAIVGIETNYGRSMGSYRVIDALRTLAFDYPPRAGFFSKELEQFLLMSREERFDPLSIKGSYAGAMGIAQFMPSSYRSYAVDFDNDGIRDLFGNMEDALASVANYFARHGWENGAPAALRASIRPALASDQAALQRLVSGTSAKPGQTLAALRAAGVRPDTQDGHVGLPEKVSLLALAEAPGRQSYWIAFPNFYVIKRYNNSVLYSMAITQLAEAVSAGLPTSRNLPDKTGNKN